MADRASPLNGADFGAFPGLALSTRRDLSVLRVAAWPESAARVADALARGLGVAPPAPSRASAGGAGALARVGPLEWWLIDAAAPRLDAGDAVPLDLSHGLAPIAVEGPDAAALLARIVSVDLRPAACADARPAACPVGAFLATGGPHMALRLWRRGPQSFELLAPRSEARWLLALLRESAARL